MVHLGTPVQRAMKHCMRMVSTGCDTPPILRNSGLGKPNEVEPGLPHSRSGEILAELNLSELF